MKDLYYISANGWPRPSRVKLQGKFYVRFTVLKHRTTFKFTSGGQNRDPVAWRRLLSKYYPNAYSKGLKLRRCSILSFMRFSELSAGSASGSPTRKKINFNFTDTSTNDTERWLLLASKATPNDTDNMLTDQMHASNMEFLKKLDRELKDTAWMFKYKI